VRAAAKQRDLDAVAGRLRAVGSVADLSGSPGHDVLGEDHVRLGEAIKQAVVDHRLRGLLGRLEDFQQASRAAPRLWASSVVAPTSQVTCMS
jgi:hypothetical protein